MKKINCILCFRNFIQIGIKPTCPYCKKHIEDAEFVTCRPIDETEMDHVVNIGDEIDLFPDKFDDEAEVNDDSVVVDGDEGPQDEKIDTDEDSHEESSE